VTGTVIAGACRTAVAPRGGAFRSIEAWDLAAAPIRALLAAVGLPAGDIDAVILGNALYGGGNPARLALLAAGIPEDRPALTVDSQCCAGLDAIALAAARIRAGDADVVVAGGVESFSRAPERRRRPLAPGEPAVPYERPPFSPWPARDPDMIPAAADLAQACGIARTRQEDYAVASHAAARAAPPSPGEIVDLAGLTRDAFARRLTPALCARLPALAGDAGHAVTAATVAVEADAAAVVLVVSDRVVARLRPNGRAIRIAGTASAGGDPAMPGLAPIAASRRLLARLGLAPHDVAVAEVMEAFAVQAIACIEGIGLDPARVNRGGGALARGHPIGASGAILAVRLWHELQKEQPGSHGLATIAAAGGLGSAMLLRA